MKVTLTSKEVNTIVGEYFINKLGFLPTIEILAVGAVLEHIRQWNEVHANEFLKIEHFLNVENNKIGAIKELRTVTGWGLYEAKTAVENWTAFKAACTTQGMWVINWRGTSS
jgi:ribosomal protein L7/L12